MKDKFETLRLNLGVMANKLAPIPWTFKKPLKVKNKIPILIPGGVGDVILAIPAIISIRKMCGPVIVYSNWPQVFSFFEKDESKSNNDFPGYDYWIRLIGIVKFEFQDNFTGFDNRNVENLYMNWRSEISGWERILDCHPFLDSKLVQKAIAQGNNRENLAFRFLRIPYTGHRTYDITKTPNHGHLTEPYITIHHGYESTLTDIGTRSTKNWHPELFAEFVQMMHRMKIKVVQLGGKTGSSIDWVDFDFRGKITLPQSFRILAGSLCHIDGDSGLVHAARALGVRSVVLWGSTHSAYYGHRENININPPYCGGCFWLKPDWMANCPLGYARPLCMDSIEPKTVMDAAFKIAMTSIRELIKPGRDLPSSPQGTAP